MSEENHHNHNDIHNAGSELVSESKKKHDKKQFFLNLEKYRRPFVILIIIIASALEVKYIINTHAASVDPQCGVLATEMMGPNCINNLLYDAGCPPQGTVCSLTSGFSRSQIYQKQEKPIAPNVVYQSYDWGPGPVIQSGIINKTNAGAKAYGTGVWGVIAQNQQCDMNNPNASVEVKDMKLYILSSSDNSWHLVADSNVAGKGDYIFSGGVDGSGGDITGRFTPRGDRSGTMTFKMYCDGSSMAHFYTNQVDISPHANNVAGLYMTMQARLVKWDENGIDDLDAAQNGCTYLVQVASDWWLREGTPYDGYTNSGSSIGKFKCVKRDWRAINAITFDGAGGQYGISAEGYNKLISNPPPGVGANGTTPPQPPTTPPQPPTTSPPPTSGSSDVIVESINITPVTPKVGDAVSFNAVIKNIGSTATPVGTVIGVDFSVDGVTATCGYTSTALAAGATTTITPSADCANITTWAATTGSHTIVGYVDDINRFTESNENNNKLSKTLTIGAISDTTKPTVSITSPANNASVSGNTNITINANDNVGVSKVEVFQGTTLLGNATAGGSNFSFNWPTSTVGDGTYRLTAKATDTSGNSTTSNAVSVKVSNTASPPTTTLPDVVVTSVVPSIATPRTGDTLYFIATIKNQGSAAVAAGSLLGVGFGIDGANPSNSGMWGCANTTVSGQCNGLAKALLPGDYITVTSFGGIQWIASLGTHKLTAYVNDVAGRFTESSTSNNVLADHPFSVTAPVYTAQPSVPTSPTTKRQLAPLRIIRRQIQRNIEWYKRLIWRTTN